MQEVKAEAKKLEVLFELLTLAKTKQAMVILLEFLYSKIVNNLQTAKLKALEMRQSPVSSDHQQEQQQYHQVFFPSFYLHFQNDSLYQKFVFILNYMSSSPMLQSSLPNYHSSFLCVSPTELRGN